MERVDRDSRKNRQGGFLWAEVGIFYHRILSTSAVKCANAVIEVSVSPHSEHYEPMNAESLFVVSPEEELVRY